MAGSTIAAERWELGHRPGLDGARGLAIGLVLLGHAMPAGFAAGSVGVALFFVLSGFLITSLLLEEKDRTGAIDLGQFYVRRIRRLLPAFVVVWLAVLASMVAIGQAREGLFDGLVAASYFGNWVMAAGTFLGPLTHTWSLAIEEQFYLVCPVILLVAVRYLRAGHLALLFVGVAAAIQLLRAWGALSGVSWESLAYRTDLQADGLLLGCALAIVMHVRPFSVPSVIRPLALAGLVAIAFIVPERVYGVVGNSATVLLSTALVAALVSPSGRDILFENRFLTFLGLISYGLYLWHYPILWHLGYSTGGPYPGPGLAVLGIALSVAVAVASYVWIEAPFRRGSARRAPDNGQLGRVMRTMAVR